MLRVSEHGMDHNGTNQVQFSIEDTGRGIPARELDRILQPFEQIRDTSDIEGTGLGLAIVQKIVQRMNGRLHIESAEGTGSTFNVLLPIAQSESGSATIGPDEKASANPAGTKQTEMASTPAGPMEPVQDEMANQPEGCRILVADDNELNRFVASKLLMRWGYEVTEAVNGKEAIEAWENEGACLILMDVQMPVMDGIEATLWIRNQEREKGLPRSPILALTADAEEQTYKRILAADMDDRIVKPFDPTALRALIEKLAAKMSSQS